MFTCLAPTSSPPQASHPVQHRLRRSSRTVWAHDRRWEREHRPHWSETTITKIKIVVMVFLLRVHILTWNNADMLVQKGIRPKDALLVAIRQNLSNWKIQKKQAKSFKIETRNGEKSFQQKIFPTAWFIIWNDQLDFQCLPSCSFSDLDFREEYVDGAEYLLKHEEDTHVEGQV